MARFAEEITISGGVDYQLSSISGYTPAPTDKIIITPLTHGGHTGNVKIYLTYVSSTWKIKSSDSTFAGKVLVVIKT